MFNLFGSLFFSSGRQNQVDEQLKQTEEVSTQTLSNTNTVLEPSNPDNSKQQGLDWVIVDRSEEADKCDRVKTEQNEIGVNTSIIQNESDASDENMLLGDEKEKEVDKKSMFDRDEDDNDVILGSFFEKNAQSTDDDLRYKTTSMGEEEEEEERVEPNKDWLITPLPCLTSITASQRSIENDPLENLLIEHPSMSVFVTATSSDSDSSFNQENATTETSQIVIIMQSKEKSGKKQALKELTEDSLSKSQGEKRKGSDNTMQAESPNSTLLRQTKRNRRNKKSPVNGHSAALSSNNKENLQVKTLLLNDARKTSAQQAIKCEILLNNKNQMKRNNKNATFKSNVNVNKRKYHKLQQPMVFNNVN